MLKTRGESFEGKICAVSGSGNVAQYTVEKLNQLGGKVVTLSDSDGTIYDQDGIDAEKLAWVMELKNVRRGRIKEYADKFKAASTSTASAPGTSSATAPSPAPPRTRSTATTPRRWSRTAASCVGEGANMPTTPEAVEVFLAAKILYGPGKAANAGGVATSGLEMSQNSHAPRLDARGSGPAPAPDHDEHPRDAASSTARIRRLRSTTSWAPTSPASSRSPTR